ncbi:BlaI/MecI/CopY family transcriptional regulator [Parvularcula maris]|uniref:BlaI/MecI/CopY family transcriptional regulator n=1 Tax=Parvularcula maris TaxID=2965077 RepID=A0A9X2L741_9PROT|nr:BlaI/MecI/CopY family transcriptional regulator [Parvularcula maris]
MQSDPSETELRLLKVLWPEGRLSAREIHDAAAVDTGWSFSTTRKTLERMEAKGLIAAEPLHGIKTFVPLRSKLDVVGGLVTRFARNVLDLDGPLPAAAFTGSRLLDEGEAEELEQLLRDLSEGEGDA